MFCVSNIIFNTTLVLHIENSLGIKKTSKMSLTHKITNVPNSQTILENTISFKKLDWIFISHWFWMPSRKHADTFLFTFEYLVLVSWINIFWIKKRFWLMSLPASCSSWTTPMCSPRQELARTSKPTPKKTGSTKPAKQQPSKTHTGTPTQWCHTRTWHHTKARWSNKCPGRTKPTRWQYPSCRKQTLMRSTMDLPPRWMTQRREEPPQWRRQGVWGNNTTAC